jgi:transcriptional antiterminator NusG
MPGARRAAPTDIFENLISGGVEMTNTAAPYAPGDLVRVVDGPFANFAGVVREVDATHHELLVEVAIFGRPVPIRTEPWQVAPR